mgnify:CR=1 FL=1
MVKSPTQDSLGADPVKLFVQEAIQDRLRWSLPFGSELLLDVIQGDPNVSMEYVGFSDTCRDSKSEWNLRR